MNALQIPQYADTVVIGGGTAGAAVAGLLAERGDRSVLLLEAGPDYGHRTEGRWPTELLDGRILASTHDWTFTSAAANGQPGHAAAARQGDWRLLSAQRLHRHLGQPRRLRRLGCRGQRRLVDRRGASLLPAGGGTTAACGSSRRRR